MEDNTYNVQIEIDTESLEIQRGGEKFTLPVRVTNNSSRDLFYTHWFFLSYHVYTADGTSVQWDNGRFDLQLIKGKTRVITIENEAPAKKGDYIFQFDIVQEGVEWYSAKGMPCPVLAVKVLQDGSVLFHELEKELQIQRTEEAEWRKILDSKQYDFFHPFCKLNPYGRSPLSAILLFTTNDKMAIQLHISGKTKEACVDAQFMQYEKEHLIPIYGLYAGKTNQIVIKGIYKNGKIVENCLEITTCALEEDIENISLITCTKDEKRYAPGMNFCYSALEDKGKKIAYDIHGDVRWYFTGIYSEVANFLSINSVWLTKNAPQIENTSLIYEFNLMGRIQTVYLSPYGAHHELEFTSNGTMLILGHSKEVSQDRLVEIDLESGEIVYVQDYKKLLQRTRNIGAIYSNNDWLHLNAAVEYQGDFIVSGNTQSTVLRHDRNGKIKWMLCDPTDYGTYWQQYILKPVGSDFEYPYNQHAIQVLPDINKDPDTIDILLFDNGTSRNKAGKLDDLKHPLYSRMVHYQINEKEMTVRQIWEYGKERPELFSMWRGDANQQENGNRIGVFNVRQKNEIDGKNYMEHCVVVEVDKEKNIIWECYGCSMTGRNSYQNYRLERKTIYDSNEKNIDLNQEVKIKLPETGEEKD